MAQSANLLPVPTVFSRYVGMYLAGVNYICSLTFPLSSLSSEKWRLHARGTSSWHPCSPSPGQAVRACCAPLTTAHTLSALVMLIVRLPLESCHRAVVVIRPNRLSH